MTDNTNFYGHTDAAQQNALMLERQQAAARERALEAKCAAYEKALTEIRDTSVEHFPHQPIHPYAAMSIKLQKIATEALRKPLSDDTKGSDDDR